MGSRGGRSHAGGGGTQDNSGTPLSLANHAQYEQQWILFGNQFTPDDVLDGYPVDRLMHDIALALMAVQTQTTEILSEFPTKAAETEKAETLPS